MSDDYKFPLLMKSTATGLIVLMESVDAELGGTGVVKGTGHTSSSNSIGDWSDTWNMQVFKPLVETIGGSCYGR